MNKLEIRMDGNRINFRPQETVQGKAYWQLEKRPKSMEIRLFWFTRGKGTVDAEIQGRVVIENLCLQGEMPFCLQLPDAPYSFSGKLISLSWAIELVVEPLGEAAIQEFVVSPTGKEIVLCATKNSA